MGARVYAEYLRLHFKSAMEYRRNFFIQTTFMILNDAMWLVVFYLLFKEFGTVNGYTSIDAMLVFGIGAFGFGIVFVFFGNVGSIWQPVADGSLDYYLNKPVDELFHILIGRMNYSAVGDILLGLTIMLLLAPTKFHIAVLAALLGAIVLLSFEILISSLSFFLDRPKNLTKSLHRFIVGFSVWPIDAYSSMAKATLYIIMVAFIAAFPRRVIMETTAINILVLIAVAAGLLLASIALFKLGIRRYESGNMMTVRT